jgi:hypothetical protein
VSGRAEALRRRILGPGFWLWKWRSLPLAAFAGLRVEVLDDAACTVLLPGGWRTQNPFRSTYFAAQAMAAELSTGAPALVLARTGPASVSMLVTDFRAAYRKRVVGPCRFTFADVAAMAAAVAEAAGSPEPRTFAARSVGRDAAGDVCTEAEVTWSFKRRG